MRQFSLLVSFLVLLTLAAIQLPAQDCVLQDPVLKIDFGNAERTTSGRLNALQNYQRESSNCPQDGFYSLSASTGNCFDSHWITIPEDHTPGDAAGNMLLINAAYQPGLFFRMDLQNLKPATIYEMGAWVVNVCKPYEDCTGNRPNLRFMITTGSGTIVARFSTGDIAPTGTLAWLQYKARFTTPAGTENLVLKIENKTEGGCGNDFAMDDISFRECKMTDQLIVPAVRKETIVPVKTITPKPTPPVKEKPVLPKPVIKDRPELAKVPVKDTVVKTVIKRPITSFIPPPPLIVNRENPVVKRIQTGIEDIRIDLYDNGEIDGDTVTIYHNNELAISRAAISAKPVTIYIRIDAKHPHHEVVMVANNLGSIPPNTSLMVITAKDKRYEVFISSTEQKNAKIVFDLDE